MRVRYERNSEGNMVLQAKVYSPSEHAIERQLLSKEVLHIIAKLQQRGFQACIVGGAVRDLLIGRTPKDFDVACNARPEEVRRAFSNSRIIGKRFRLVHVIYPGNHVVEVATFRALSNSDHKPVYGSIDQDAKRRDFSLNGLYYDPQQGNIIDYVNGMADIKKRIIRPIIPLEQIFVEDPVRLLRCLKFSAMFDCRIAASLNRQLKKDLPLLATSSHSRLSEELLKILSSGHAAAIFRTLFAYHACRILLPHYPLPARDRRTSKAVLKSLEQLDALRQRETVSLGEALAHLLGPVLQHQRFEAVAEDAQPLFLHIKETLSPLSFANVEVLRCLGHLCKLKGISTSYQEIVSQKWVQRRRNYTGRRGRKPATLTKERRRSKAGHGGDREASSSPPRADRRRRKPQREIS